MTDSVNGGTHVLVPREPTETMLTAGAYTDRFLGFLQDDEARAACKHIWEDMIAATPATPAPSIGVERIARIIEAQEIAPVIKQRLIAAITTKSPAAIGVERLLTALAKVMPIRVNDGPDYAEAYFADGAQHSTQAMTMNPADWREINDAFAALANPRPTIGEKGE